MLENVYDTMEAGNCMKCPAGTAARSISELVDRDDCYRINGRQSIRVLSGVSVGLPVVVAAVFVDTITLGTGIGFWWVG